MIINVANFNFCGDSVGGGSSVSGIDFSTIGYDAELSAELNEKYKNDVAYSKTLYDAWNPRNTSAYQLYYNDIKLVYAPNIDTSNVDSMYQMFYGCISLQIVPKIDTSKVESMQYLFAKCSSLTSVPLINTSNATYMNNMFQGCTSLTSVPELDSSKVTNFQYMFEGCDSLTTIEGISFKSFSASTMNSYYLVGNSSNSSIRKAVFKDIGYQSNAKEFNVSYINNWGENTDEIPNSRQSLIDSLITYSFDRATAGYPTCKIILSYYTKSLLTEDEKAQIEAKGFTIA